MPRRYRMKSRNLSIERTQARIVLAAKKLHADQGIQGTSYIDIAQKSGVSQATVYRHFPTLADLIPACARSIEVLQPMSREKARQLFQGQENRPMQRLEWIIRGTCECYQREEGWLQAALREGDLIPTLAEIVQEQQKGLRILAQTALEHTNLSEINVQVLAALMDFPLWKSLRDMGLEPAEATRQVIDLALDYLVRENLSLSLKE